MRSRKLCCLYVHFKRILPGLFANYLLIKLSMISRWWDHQPLLVKSRSHQCLWVHLITTNVLAICLAIWHGHLFKKNTDYVMVNHQKVLILIKRVLKCTSIWDINSNFDGAMLKIYYGSVITRGFKLRSSHM